jgi:protein-disulfide isomerase
MPLYQTSVPISEASLCARDQDKFWEYKDILYANQDSSNPNAFSDRRLEAFAEAIGLNLDEFNACTNERKYRSEVEQIGIDATNLNVKGTPTFFINGKLVENRPIEGFRAEIDAALAATEGS